MSVWQKGYNQKSESFFGLIPTFLEVRGGKLIGGEGVELPPLPILNRVQNLIP